VFFAQALRRFESGYGADAVTRDPTDWLYVFSMCHELGEFERYGLRMTRTCK
jgi:hypothetical protein